MWGREYRALYSKLHFNQGNYWRLHEAAFSFFPFLEQGTQLASGTQTRQDAFLTSPSWVAVGVSADINQHEIFSRKKSPIWKGFAAKGKKVFKGKTTQHAAPEAKLNFHFRSEHSVRAECSSTFYSKLFFLSYISVDFRFLYKLLLKKKSQQL